MIVVKKGLPGIIPDNDMAYITFVSKVVHKIDKDAELTIIRGIRTYSYNITPSDPRFKTTLIEEIVLAHKVIGVAIQFSRTLEMSQSIYFELL